METLLPRSGNTGRSLGWPPCSESQLRSVPLTPGGAEGRFPGAVR